MRRTPLNDGWTFRPKVDRFAELIGAGAEWAPVTLPHDAMIGTRPRSPAAGPATGYFPGGVWEYRRTLDVAPDDAGRGDAARVRGRLPRRGRDRERHGRRPPALRLLELLRPDRPPAPVGRERDHGRGPADDDCRWYSRRRHLPQRLALAVGPVHLVPDGLDVRTPEVDDDGAVVAVATVVRNRVARVRRRRRCASRSSTPTARCRPCRRAGHDVPAATPSRPGSACSSRDPQRWGPDDPHLYSCRARLLDGDEVLDEEATTFGIRIAGARSRSAACGSTASRSCCAAPASTTTTARSARRRSTGPRSAGSSC